MIAIPIALFFGVCCSATFAARELFAKSRYGGTKEFRINMGLDADLSARRDKDTGRSIGGSSWAARVAAAHSSAGGAPLIARMRWAIVCVTIAVGLLPTTAHANAPIHSFTITPSTTQAGGHPDIETVITLGNRENQHIPAPTCDCQDAKDIFIESPAGIIADPHAVPQCTAADFGEDRCPVDSQVGKVVLNVSNETVGQRGLALTAVFNLVPHPGEAGLIAFNVPLLASPIFIVVNPRTESDYGLNLAVTDINHLFGLADQVLTLWGIPADPSHDAERLPVGWDSFEQGTAPPQPSDSPLAPYLNNPTTCGVPLSATARVLAYDLGTSEATTSYPPTTGCDQLSFNPSLYAQPTTTATDSASGLAINLQVPQQQSPTVPSPSEIKEATLELPKGVSINPNAADGKSACTDSEARFHTQEEAQCPEFSKVGSLSVISSALPGPLPGYIYIGEPQSGNRYRIILAADGFGIHVKLPGTVTPNSQTGQLLITFKELPQTPFEDFNLHFFGSERGILATPDQCGEYAVNSTFTPWDSELPKQSSTQYFKLDSGPYGAACPGPTRSFAPRFEAGVDVHTGGSHSDFSLDLTRSDGEQNVSALSVTTPPGFAATLAGVPYCSDPALQSAAEPGYSGLEEESSPSCPVASQIGTATTGAGSGTHPVYIPGKVYLAGPYKGAPLSLAVIIPAVSGPYDLGDVVVRAALQINPETAQVTAVSDPLPQILEGIPLRIRSVLISLNRPQFALNPTNCDPFSIGAKALGDPGSQADLTYPFQVTNCSTLPFSPKFSLGLSGSSGHAGNPSLHTTLTANPGEANISKVQATLPHSEFLDNAHLQAPCTRVQYADQQCPPGSMIGFAKADTPLLEKPIEGPVYLRAGGANRKLPDIVAALNGQIDITLVGHVESVPGRIRTTFSTVPDAPVSKFTLNLDGGNKGLLENGTNLCDKTLRANVEISGQNGKNSNQNPAIQTTCGRSPKLHVNRGKAAL